MKNKKEMPSRTLDCLPCCESFFLPTRAYLHDALPSRCLLSSCRTQQNYWLHKTKSPSIPINLLLGMKAISVEQQTCGEMLCLPKRYFVLQDIIVKLLQRKLLAPRGCFKMATCDAQTENQYTTAYGILVSVGLTLLLLIIYNFSDQVLHLREKNKAKSREAAKRSARET
ncbi:putative white-brown complex homolog protein 30 isoform X3 [Apium graveolens]